MKSAPNQPYHEDKTETFVIFDVRIPGVAERFHSERAAWPECNDVETLDHMDDWRLNQMRMVEEQEREGLARLLAGGNR